MKMEVIFRSENLNQQSQQNEMLKLSHELLRKWFANVNEKGRNPWFNA